MAITATMVRELREMTGAAMMDCKKALEAVGGDMGQAVDHLRKLGMKAAEKKAERSTAEGRVFAVTDEGRRRGHLVAVACETDFLAKGEGFRELVAELSAHVAGQDPDGVDQGERPILHQSWNGAGPTVAEKLQEAIGRLKENVRVSELARIEAGDGRVGTYVHHDAKQGAIAAVTGAGDPAKADEILRGLCQHIVVFRPSCARREDVPAEDVDREREVLLASDEVQKKPEEFRSKIVEGKLGKFYERTVLEEQPWIHDDKVSVKKALERELGAGARVAAFARIAIGG